MTEAIAALDKKPDVNTPSDLYRDQESLRVICRDMLAGLPRLKEKAETYLPRSPAEEIVMVPGVGLVDPWKLRVEHSQYDGFFPDAVDTAVGHLMAERPKPSEEMPDALKTFLLDVDGRGSDIFAFGAQTVTTSVGEGQDFVLVDYPRVGDGRVLTVEEERRLGLNPFWRHYSPGSVIDWDFEDRNGKERLTYVRLREKYTVPNGEWGKTRKDQVRVIRAGNPDAPTGSVDRLVRFQIFRKDGEKNEWREVVALGGFMSPQVDIPLIDFSTGSYGPFLARPAYLNISWIDLAIFRMLSYLHSGMRAVGFPILHWAGAPFEINEQGQKVPMKTQGRMLYSELPEARVEYAEVAGTAWKAVQDEIESMRRQGKRISAEAILDQMPRSLTATGEAIRSAKKEHRFLAWAESFEDSFSRLLYHTAIFKGIVEHGADSGWGKLTLNKDFSQVQKSREQLEERMWLHSIGQLSGEAAFEQAKRNRAIDDGLKYEDEQRRIAKESMREPAEAIDLEDGEGAN